MSCNWMQIYSALCANKLLSLLLRFREIYLQHIQKCSYFNISVLATLSQDHTNRSQQKRKEI